MAFSERCIHSLFLLDCFVCGFHELDQVGSLREARSAFHALLEMQPAHSDGLRLLGDTERALEEEGTTDSGQTSEKAGQASMLEDLGSMTKFFTFGADTATSASTAAASAAAAAAVRNLSVEDDDSRRDEEKVDVKDEWVRMVSRTRPGDGAGRAALGEGAGGDAGAHGPLRAHGCALGARQEAPQKGDRALLLSFSPCCS